MKAAAPPSFGAQLKALREAAGFTQAELATIAGLSVHAVSALERGHRRRPHLETVRVLSAALDLTGPARDGLFASARALGDTTSGDELGGVTLPVPPTALLGREGDLEILRRWMADPVRRLITLTGPGGVGKTRLAIEVARTIADEGSAHVAFVALASIRDPELAAGAIAEALGLADISPADLTRRARAACEGRPTLLLVDNFEQVLEAAPVAAELLGATTLLRLLVTSRAPLHLRGEREYVVGPLALDAEPTSGDDGTGSPAVHLYVERIRDVQPDFRVTAENASTVAAICRRLDALPLALELAAAWTKVLTVDDLLVRLDESGLLATATLRDLPERQQTMNATVAWSYQLLNPMEQRVFRRLGVLPGRFPADAAAAVAAGRSGAVRPDDVLEPLAGLIDKSLLLRAETSTPTRPLYRMLETVRAYAALELAGTDEREDAVEGLARYCGGEAARAAAGLVGPVQAGWLDRVREDLESHRSLLTWLLERGRATEASAIAFGLLLFWLIRGHAAEGLRWYEQILALPSLSPAVESASLIGSALMLYMQGEHGRGRSRLDRALSLASSAGNMSLAAHAETLFGHFEHANGNLDAACDRFARGAEIFRTLRMPWGVGSALSGMGGAALSGGDPVRAERLLDEATTLLRDTSPWFLAPVRCLRAVLAVQRNSADEAIALMRESLVQIRELRDTYAFVHALVPLAAAALLKGESAWAARLLGACDAVAERTGVSAIALVGALHERTERDIRGRLGPDRWARAYAAGRRASIDSLLRDIDAQADRPRVRPRAERARRAATSREARGPDRR